MIGKKEIYLLQKRNRPGNRESWEKEEGIEMKKELRCITYITNTHTEHNPYVLQTYINKPKIF